MIFVDTSVWVAALRDRNSLEGHHMATLLEGDEVALSAPVRIEILSGASRQDYADLRRVLSALPLFFPHSVTWERIDHWVQYASSKREHFSIADLVIASIARDQDSAIWSLDGDFGRMASLNFIELYTPA